MRYRGSSRKANHPTEVTLKRGVNFGVLLCALIPPPRATKAPRLHASGRRIPRKEAYARCCPNQRRPTHGRSRAWHHRQG
jgi:hypothetical protein